MEPDSQFFTGTNLEWESFGNGQKFHLICIDILLKILAR